MPVKQGVKDLFQNWVTVMTLQRSDNYRWLMTFKQGEDNKIVAEIIDTSRIKDDHDKPEIVSSKIDGDKIRIEMKNGHESFDFEGFFQQGFIRGTIKLGTGDLILTRMLPTDATSIQDFPETGLPPGFDVFETIMKSKEAKPEELLALLHEYRTSPLAQEIFTILINSHGQLNLDEAKTEEAIKEYIGSARIWGPRWEARTDLTIAAAMLAGRKFPQLALPRLDEAEKLVGDKDQAALVSINAYRDAAKTYIRITELTNPNSTDEVRATAAAELTELLKKQPFNSEILWALITQEERTGQVDQAIDHLSDIVALPLMEATIIKLRQGLPPDTPAPHEMLKKLWAQKHGNEDGYDQHLAQVYDQKIGVLLDETQKNGPPVSTAERGNKPVLVELFTGALSPNCIAADLATTAIGKTYPSNEVITIEYHQNVPGPDGLANQDSEERAAFYEITSTPIIIVDGAMIDSRYYSGLTASTPGAYGVLRAVIDPLLAAKTDVTLKLSAAVTDGQLAVTAEATGVPEDVLPACRLRMAIVENNVETRVPLASNGICHHNFVVREVLGGAKGISPKNGELKYSLSMPIAELQQHITDYISRFEAGRRLEFFPAMKPSIQGPLSLVAWVQNGTRNPNYNSRPVLQSAIIPISGDTGFEKQAAASKSATEPPAKPPATEPAPASSADPK